jgi:hypothetical protein
MTMFTGKLLSFSGDPGTGSSVLLDGRLMVWANSEADRNRKTMARRIVATV